jgi:hypothetical protein
MTDWQPIKTLNVHRRTRCLGWVPVGKKGKGYVCLMEQDDYLAWLNRHKNYLYDVEIQCEDENRKRIKPTYWMPLPEPPILKEGE